MAVWSVDTWDRFISNGKDSASFDISDDREGVLTRLRARIALIFLVDILGGVAILKAERRTRRSRVRRLQAGVASENSTFNSAEPSNSLAQGSTPTPGTTRERQHQEKMKRCSAARPTSDSFLGKREIGLLMLSGDR
jgi:hypothetical protein